MLQFWCHPSLIHSMSFHSAKYGARIRVGTQLYASMLVPPLSNPHCGYAHSSCYAHGTLTITYFGRPITMAVLCDTRAQFNCALSVYKSLTNEDLAVIAFCRIKYSSQEHPHLTTARRDISTGIWENKFLPDLYMPVS